MSTALKVTALKVVTCDQSLNNVEYVQDSSYSAEQDAWEFESDSSKKDEAIQWNVKRKAAENTVQSNSFQFMYTQK